MNRAPVPSFLLALLFILPSSGVALGDRGVRFEATECWNPTPNDTRTRCGYLWVPESWDKPGDRQIRLPVAIFPGTEATADRSAVFFLEGGPGSTTGIDRPRRREGWREFADSALAGRDFVVFDQRGAPLSQPALLCPELEDPDLWLPLSEDPQVFSEPRQRKIGKVKACAERLMKEGHDLTVYNSRQSASDVDALRAQLGYERIILYGVSYGTLLAQWVLEHHPEAIEAAVLDSVSFAPERRRNGKVHAYFAFRRLLDACRDQPRCGKAYPELSADFVQLLKRLAEDPIVVEIANVEGTAPLYARVDDAALIDILFLALYRNLPITKLPWVINGLSKGRTHVVRPLVEDDLYHPFLQNGAIGMHYSVSCHDYNATDEIDGLAGDDELASLMARWAEQGRRNSPCGHWPSSLAVPDALPAVSSDLPVLLLSGAFDSTTPVEYAEAAAAKFTGSYSFVFPASGHDQVSRDRCAYQTFVDFIADPSQRPAAACLSDLRQPSFLVLGGG